MCNGMIAGCGLKYKIIDDVCIYLLLDFTGRAFYLGESGRIPKKYSALIIALGSQEFQWRG